MLDSGSNSCLNSTAFVLGLMAGGLLVSRIVPTAFETATAAPATIVVAGLLVGFGTALGGGCTSGHGVSRLSPRSLLAVASFMSMGMVTVFLVGRVLERLR